MTLNSNGPHLNRNTLNADRAWFNNLNMDMDPDSVRFMDDFLRVAFDDVTAADRILWTQVNDSGATVGIVADTQGGEAQLLSAATTDGDGASIQGNEIWAVATGRFMFYETIVNFHDADDCDFAAGFTENFATNPEAMLTAANRICFQVDEGNASILCKTESGGTETSTDSEVDAADTTDVTLGIRCVGLTVVEFYVNRILVATHETNVPTANLALGCTHISGSTTGTFSMEIDYIMAAMTR